MRYMFNCQVYDYVEVLIIINVLFYYSFLDNLQLVLIFSIIMRLGIKGEVRLVT